MEAGRKSGDWAVWDDERERKNVSERKTVQFRDKDAKFKVPMEVIHVTRSAAGSGGAEPTECPGGTWEVVAYAERHICKVPRLANKEEKEGGVPVRVNLGSSKSCLKVQGH